MKFRFWHFELLLIIFFFAGAFVILRNPPPRNPDFVPDAVNGLVTASGILTAFTGYLITYIIPRIRDTPKAWIGIRIVVVLFSILIGLLIVGIGLSELVFGSMEGAYESALLGEFLIILAFFEVMAMVIIRELEQTTNLSDTF